VEQSAIQYEIRPLDSSLCLFCFEK